MKKRWAWRGNRQILDRHGVTRVCGDSIDVKSCDYTVDGNLLEAVVFRPLAQGKHPGLLLIPGFAVTASDYVPHGLRFARDGFACMAVTQPGFGRSEDERDWVGPQTIHALAQGFLKLQREAYVDQERMSVCGYSRGAMAASLLAVRLTDVKAAVFCAGIYDFRRAYEETGKVVVRQSMMRETGMTDRAVQERSSVFQMENLPCPVLILHGEQDINVPVTQVYLLRDELVRLNKEFEIRTFPDRTHRMGFENLYADILRFLTRTLE